MQAPVDLTRVEALLEALPFIQKFRGQTFVIKYGGSAMEDEHLVDRTLRNVVFLEAVGIRPVLVHGGGKAITSRMREAGLKAQFVNGLRVTDPASMEIVESTLDGVINPMIVGKIEEFDGHAVGLSGREVIRARRCPPQTSAKGAPVDLGSVGDVIDLDLTKVESALRQGAVPVISPVGLGEGGESLNVNADVAAGAIASRLGAARLVYISDVRGIMRDPNRPESLIPSVNREAIEGLIAAGIIEGGMLPKVESAVAALAQGVARAHLIDGRIAQSILLELFTPSRIGTEIVP